MLAHSDSQPVAAGTVRQTSTTTHIPRRAHDPASRNRRDRIVITTVYNPTGGRMFLINLFGKKVGAHDPAGGGWGDRITIMRF